MKFYDDFINLQFILNKSFTYNLFFFIFRSIDSINHEFVRK